MYTLCVLENRVSLLDLAEITEEGVKFRNPDDGSTMMLTPEKSIALQNSIGGDVMMALDDVVSSTCPSRERFEEATARTVRWLDRCIAAHGRPKEQCIFAIVQGGLDTSEGGLRDQNLRDLILREKKLGGYAIGGLAGGESKDAFWRVVNQCTHKRRGLPAHKPRYLMGVGYPVDLVVCVALGVDMFDCVYPTRTARFGVALTNGRGGENTTLVKLNRSTYATDCRNISDPSSWGGHPVSQMGTRSGMRSILKTDKSDGNGVGGQLLSLHNLSYMLELSKQMRRAIIEKRFKSFVRTFMLDYYPDCDYPQWILDAMKEAEISLIHRGVPSKPQAGA